LVEIGHLWGVYPLPLKSVQNLRNRDFSLVLPAAGLSAALAGEGLAWWES
jgi:hypothetical protein